MDINLNINIKAPGIEEALNTLLVLYGNSNSKAPVAVIPAEEPTKRTRSHKNQTEKPAPETTQEVTTAATETASTTEEKDKAPDLAPTPEPEPEQAAPIITLEQVREKLANLARAGKKDQIKKLLDSFGAKKLTDVPAEKYAELMEKAEGI